MSSHQVKPLVFPERDPDRPAKEAALRLMDGHELMRLYEVTRSAASEARKRGDMEKLYPLARSMKTIQRLADERGLVIHARSSRRSDA